MNTARNSKGKQIWMSRTSEYWSRKLSVDGGRYGQRIDVWHINVWHRQEELDKKGTNETTSPENDQSWPQRRRVSDMSLFQCLQWMISFKLHVWNAYFAFPTLLNIPKPIMAEKSRVESLFTFIIASFAIFCNKSQFASLPFHFTGKGNFLEKIGFRCYCCSLEGSPTTACLIIAGIIFLFIFSLIVFALMSAGVDFEATFTEPGMQFWNRSTVMAITLCLVML